MNEPLVTVLLPVALVPACGISTSENVPATLFTVFEVIVTLPLPPSTLAVQSAGPIEKSAFVGDVAPILVVPT